MFNTAKEIKAAFNAITVDALVPTKSIQMDSVIMFALATGHMLRHDFSFVLTDEDGKMQSIGLDEMVWLHNHAEIIPELVDFAVFKLVDRAYLVRQKIPGHGKQIMATKHKVKFCDHSTDQAA